MTAVLSPGYIVGSTSERRRLDSVGSSTSTSGDERTGLSLATLKRASIKRNKIRQFFANLQQNEKLMRDSNVLINEDGKAWDWDIIIAILRVRNYNLLIKRNINFYFFLDGSSS